MTFQRQSLPLITALLLVVAVLAVYYPTLQYDFVWDDQLFVVRNTAVQNWAKATEAFTSPQTTWSGNPQYNISEWRPLRNISYLIDFSLYGLRPMGWHLTNILLHALTAVLVLFLLRRLMWLLTRASAAPGPQDAENPKSANPLSIAAELSCFFATLMWALHPVQTEVVAWVKSRDDLLATPLMISALLVLLPRDQQWRGPGFLRTLAAILLFVAALLAKENAMVLALLYPAIAWAARLGWYGETTTPPDEAENIPDSSSRQGSHLAANAVRRLFQAPVGWVGLLLVGLSLGLLVVRQMLLGRTAQAAWPGTFSETVLTMLYAFARYIRLILWPWPPTVQMADYDAFPVIRSWAHAGALAGAFILLALIVLFDAARRRAPLISVGIAIFLLALLPFANIIPMMQIMAERFLYMPLIGAAIVAAGLLRPDKWWRILIPIIIVAALAVQTTLRQRVWESELTLFAATRQANPTSWRPADHFARTLMKYGQQQNALTVADQNLSRWPYDADIVRTAALAHLLAGDEAGGVALTHRAIQLQPFDGRASHTLLQWRQLQSSQSSR